MTEQYFNGKDTWNSVDLPVLFGVRTCNFLKLAFFFCHVAKQGPVIFAAGGALRFCFVFLMLRGLEG